MEDQVKALQAREKQLNYEQALLQKERECFEREKETLAKRGWRDNMYGRINVSVKTMDRVILALCVLLLAAVIVGIVVS